MTQLFFTHEDIDTMDRWTAWLANVAHTLSLRTGLYGYEKDMGAEYPAPPNQEEEAAPIDDPWVLGPDSNQTAFSYA